MNTKKLRVLAALMLGLAAPVMAQNVPNYVPTNGLVGWWPFNGNANDESGNGNNGTVNGATLTTDRFGNASCSYLFNAGLSSITISQQNNFNSAGYSTSLWVKKNQSVLDEILFHMANQSNGNETSIRYANNQFDACTGTSGGVCVESNVSFNNQWQHVVATFDLNQNIAKIYVNGILKNTINTVITPISNAVMSFGRHLTASAQFVGILDDVGVWTRPLTQQEITNLYNANICFQSITVTDTLIINTGITNFNPIAYTNTIKIFPNPANDHITIHYGNVALMSGYQLRIQNSLGQQVFSTNINQPSSYLSLANWGGNGLYFVHLIDPQGNTLDIRKIVLQ